MPIRTYSNLSIQDPSRTAIFEVDITDTGENLHQSISGVGITGIGGTYHPRAWINYAGQLDFNQFPSIPDSAVITKVTASITVVGSCSATSYPSGMAVRVESYFYKSNNTIPVLLDFVINSSQPAVENEVLSAIDLAIVTKTQLIAAYTELMISLQGFGLNNDLATPVGIPVTISLVSSSFSLVVEYDLENYSWYIKPTIQIINGIPVQLIADEGTDIIPVVNGETPPRGYVFYGTGEEFPDGLEFTWWYSDDVYEFYIYSPINPTVVSSPMAVWSEFTGVPTCVNCTSATIETATILVADASGIYKFDRTTKHDSLYVREGFSVFTEAMDVKIPNPFGKIGPVS